MENLIKPEDQKLLTQSLIELKAKKNVNYVLTNLFKTNRTECETLFVSDLLYNEKNELLDEIPEYYVFQGAPNLKVLALENLPVEMYKKKQIGIMCDVILKKLFSQPDSLVRFILRNWVLNGNFVILKKETILINCVIDINYLKGYLNEIFKNPMFTIRAPFLYECTCYNLDDKFVFDKLREICVEITQQYDTNKVVNNRRIVFNKIKNKLSKEDQLQKNGWITADESKLKLIWHNLKTRFNILL